MKERFAISRVLVPFLKIKNVFWLLLILNIPILRSGVTQMLFMNECKSSEISNQVFFNIVFSFCKNKRRTDYEINIAK